jgi:hypothetical protein
MNSPNSVSRRQLDEKLSKLSPTYCVLPFMHATADVDAILQPCCRYVTPEHSNNYTMKDFDAWWSQEQQVIRKELLEGKQHEGCANCWKDEAAGIVSYRQDCNQMHSDHVGLEEPLPRPVFWMLGIGNYCNIRCIMCSPYKSTSMVAEYEQHQHKFKKINITYDGYTRGNWSDSDLAPLESLSQDAEMIHFSGGEPMMTPDYKRVLRSVKNPTETILRINTNLTKIDHDWMELLPQFQTSINVSLEGIGEFNDYIRNGSEWADIDRNIDRLLAADIAVWVAHAFGRTSLHALPGLLDYCFAKNLPITFGSVIIPNFLSIASAPTSERIQFKNAIDQRRACLRKMDGFHRVEEFVKLLETAEYNSELDQQFWQYIDLMDELHGMNYREILNNANQA